MRWGVRSFALCHPTRLDMGGGRCKSCYLKHRYRTDGGARKTQMAAYIRAHPDLVAAIRRKHKYGISEQDWWRLYEKQKGRCAICGRKQSPREINVDHCHKRLHVRGLLCGHCNKGLGLFFDRPDLLQRAHDYLIN